MERGFQNHARKRFPDLHEVDMMNLISFFVEVDLFKTFSITTDVLIYFSPKRVCFDLASQSRARYLIIWHCHFTCNTLSLYLSGVQDKNIPVLQLL